MWRAASFSLGDVVEAADEVADLHPPSSPEPAHHGPHREEVSSLCRHCSSQSQYPLLSRPPRSPPP